MSKMSELSTAVAELRRCGEALIDISDTLRELFSGDVPSDQEPEAPESIKKEEKPAERPKPTVTLEQVRTVLAEKSVTGHRAEVQALIRECGVDKLSAVDPEKYAVLLQKAEVL